MGKTSRQKGKRGERAWAKELTDAGWPSKRGVQYQGGPDSPDVKSQMPGVHHEVKRTERLRIWDAMHQSIDEAPEGYMPIVAFKRNRHDWLVVLRKDDFFKLVREAEDQIREELEKL